MRLEPPTDRFKRPLRSLRVSVTDRCNLRCQYCMPAREYVWLPKTDILSFEEVARLVRLFVDLGVTRVRLTGGEPLLRRGLADLVADLAAIDGLDDLSLTTNGLLLRRDAQALKAAGLDRITLSLDTLQPERYRALNGGGNVADALDGLDAAHEAGFSKTKLNMVVIAGVNDDELGALLAHGRQVDAEVRFIEYMDVGGATDWRPDQVVSQRQILDRISDTHGPITPIGGRGSAPAARYKLANGQVFGVIASTTVPFCSACDRARVTADGRGLYCLYDPTGVDLRSPLREGADDATVRDLIAASWGRRGLRGAENRLAESARGAWVSAEALSRNPHLEMHTRGG